MALARSFHIVKAFRVHKGRGNDTSGACGWSRVGGLGKIRRKGAEAQRGLKLGLWGDFRDFTLAQLASVSPANENSPIFNPFAPLRLRAFASKFSFLQANDICGNIGAFAVRAHGSWRDFDDDRSSGRAGEASRGRVPGACHESLRGGAQKSRGAAIRGFAGGNRRIQIRDDTVDARHRRLSHRRHNRHRQGFWLE